MKSFKIILNEEDVDNLTYDYMCVEATVEKILRQAKEQGYIDPEKRPIDESEEPQKMTKDHMTARIIEFEKKFMNYDIENDR